MKVKIIICFCFFLLLIYFFAVFKTNFSGPDQPIYYAYTESVVEDSDLNVVNNMHFNHDDDYRPPESMRVSKTYNYPDFHNHGGVLLWVPFYVYGKFMYFLSERLNWIEEPVFDFKDFTKCALSFSNVIFGFLVLILTYWFCSFFFSAKLSFFSTLAICFGTPFFYYLLFETGNAQITATFFSIISILAINYIIKMGKWHWFIYGLFFGICIVVKVDLWFQIFFIVSLFLVFISLKKTKLVNSIFFLLGVCPPFLLKAINDYIKYGSFHLGEIGVLSLKNSYLWEMLFSSYRGYFYSSPIFYICLFGFMVAGVYFLKNFKNLNNKKNLDNHQTKNIFIFTLGFYLVVKIIIISYNYAWGGGSPGARLLLTEFPIFVILYAYVLQLQKRRFARYFLSFVSIIFIFWNLLIISEYITGVDLSYVFFRPGLSMRLQSLKKILIYLFNYRDLGLKLFLFFLPILIILCIFFYLKIFKKCGKEILFKIFVLFTFFLNVSYGYVTFLNIFNNKDNVERMKENEFFKSANILAPKDFERRENIGAMNEMIEYFTLKGDFERASRIEKQKERMYRSE
ncbi:MAG: hypothetical protein K9L61_00190 [Candidatus Omnitrophica bacterium]|nr:hypothetical protein [Candidatus Omnitrophota bacterium]